MDGDLGELGDDRHSPISYGPGHIAWWGTTRLISPASARVASYCAPNMSIPHALPARAATRPTERIPLSTEDCCTGTWWLPSCPAGSSFVNGPAAGWSELAAGCSSGPQGHRGTGAHMGKGLVVIGRLGRPRNSTACPSMSLTPLRDRAALRNGPMRKAKACQEGDITKLVFSWGSRQGPFPFPK